MANKILNTPGGVGQVPAGNIIVGNGYTGNLSTFNGKIFVFDNTPDPYNPYNLDFGVMRVRTNDGQPPINNMGATYTSAEPVAGMTNVFDISRPEYPHFFINLLYNSENVTDILGANTTEVFDMTQMLVGCTALSSINIFDTTSVTSMHYMFDECKSLKTIPQFNTHNVKDFYYMFDKCENIITVPNFDFSNATGTSTNTENVAGMFHNCKSLTHVPAFDLSNVKRLDSMFLNCSSLSAIPNFKIEHAENLDSMFERCYNVETGIKSLYDKLSVLPSITSHYCVFDDCGIYTTQGAAELAQIPDDWKLP